MVSLSEATLYRFLADKNRILGKPDSPVSLAITSMRRFKDAPKQGLVLLPKTTS